MADYNAFEYLCIDAANHLGLDKELFEVRIDYIMNRINQLEDLLDGAPSKTRPLYIKTVIAIENARKGLPIGHAVGFDATCSGIQILSALSGCVAGANATGLIDPNRRADAYTDVTVGMERELGGQMLLDRAEIKLAVMTSSYASSRIPKDLFGEDTPELAAFYAAAMKVAPGAFALLEELKDTWMPFALKHSWVLPDNFHVHVKNMVDVEAKIEIDELDHASFTAYFKQNEGEERGVANVANVTHSVDAYVLRNLIRRCNYNEYQTVRAYDIVDNEILYRYLGGKQGEQELAEDDKMLTYVERYDASRMADPVVTDHMTAAGANHMTLEHLEALRGVYQQMLVHKPFPIMSVHDEFKCHPNHMNHLRKHYREVFAQLAESEILSDIFSQMHGTKLKYKKLSNDLGDKIRKSAYAIC